MNIYNNIDLELRKLGKTRKDMCNETGISYNTIASLYRRQSENMSLETLRTICRYLNKPMEYILTGNSNIGEDNLAIYFATYEIKKDAVECINILQSRPEIKELCELCKNSSKHEINQIINLLKTFKGSN